MTDSKSTGYSKEKADKLIKQHEREAERLEKEAKRIEKEETFDRRGSKEYRDKAREERGKVENLRELKKHWGDD
jgi:hypothetical protein